ncbi:MULTISPECIES: YeeE/YedE family protein [unclassified Moraxella]|uniref:YeeE/YedE family protein n=1 Tax=unclassified Moraxella TaxID=2685852 RepID=UPI003AF77C1A
MDWANFTPIASLMGGLLIGLAAALLWWFNGKIAGVSGIIAGLLSPKSVNFSWQVCFVLGILLAPWLYQLVRPLPAVTVTDSLWQYVVAGLLVGFGTRLGSGCTSGHGICGNARLSKRSMVATVTFMLTGFLTVYVGKHILGLI